MVSLPLLPLLAVVPLLWLHCRRRSRAPALRLPPSPWALPLLGHLLHLARDLPHRGLRDLAQHHGPLLLLRLGGLPIVVASSADTAREVMLSHDVNFASCYLSRMARLSIQPGAEGIFFAPYGAEWRQLSKICTAELLSACRVLSFRPTREEEAGRLLRAVSASRAMVNLSGLLPCWRLTPTVRTIIGSRFKDRDGFLELVSTVSKLFAGMSLPDLYPSSRLAMLLSRTPPWVRQHRKELDARISESLRCEVVTIASLQMNEIY